MLMRTPASSNAYDALHSMHDFFNVARRPEAKALMELLRAQKTIRYNARQVVFREGDKAESLFLLTSGVIRLYRFMPNGRRIVARFVFPDEIIGLAFDEVCPFTAETIKPATLAKIPRSQLNALCGSSTKLQNDVVIVLKHELSAAQDDLLPMMHQNAEARIARLLSMLARRNGSAMRNGSRVQLAMTRADIADYLGLTIETVCRGLSKLKGEGLISAPSPDEIRLENVGTLIALAEGEN